jgi:hypothetical protein
MPNAGSAGFAGAPAHMSMASPALGAGGGFPIDGVNHCSSPMSLAGNERQGFASGVAGFASGDGLDSLGFAGFPALRSDLGMAGEPALLGFHPAGAQGPIGPHVGRPRSPADVLADPRRGGAGPAGLTVFTGNAGGYGSLGRSPSGPHPMDAGFGHAGPAGGGPLGAMDVAARGGIGQAMGRAVDPNAPKRYVGAYSPESRRKRIARFMEKRKQRVWTKRVKYDVRKNFADARLRVKGRFVKKEDEEMLRELMNMA